MAEEKKPTPAEEAAAAQAKKRKDMMKAVGGAALLAGSVGLMIYRLPKSRKVEVHADKPKPVAAAAPKPAAPVPVVPMKVVVPTTIPARPEKAAKAFTVDWTDACRPEIGLLCHSVPAPRLRRCLGAYDDVLLKDCREALADLQSDKPARTDVDE